MYYTLREVSELTGLSISTIRRRVRSGDIPQFKYSGKVLIPRQFVLGKESCTQLGSISESCEGVV